MPAATCTHSLPHAPHCTCSLLPLSSSLRLWLISSPLPPLRGAHCTTTCAGEGRAAHSPHCLAPRARTAKTCTLRHAYLAVQCRCIYARAAGYSLFALDHILTRLNASACACRAYGLAHRANSCCIARSPGGAGMRTARAPAAYLRCARAINRKKKKSMRIYIYLLANISSLSLLSSPRRKICHIITALVAVEAVLSSLRRSRAITCHIIFVYAQQHQHISHLFCANRRARQNAPV